MFRLSRSCYLHGFSTSGIAVQQSSRGNGRRLHLEQHCIAARASLGGLHSFFCTCSISHALKQFSHDFISSRPPGGLMGIGLLRVPNTSDKRHVRSRDNAVRMGRGFHPSRSASLSCLTWVTWSTLRVCWTRFSGRLVELAELANPSASFLLKQLVTLRLLRHDMRYLLRYDMKLLSKLRHTYTR